MHTTRVMAALALVGAVGLAVGAAIALNHPSARRELELVLDSPYGLAGLFGFSALSTAALVFPVPGMALTVVAASVAPPIVVGVIAGTGQAIGELTGYLAGRSGDELLHARLSSSRFAAWMGRHGVPSVFVLALVPNPAFDVAGAVAGALRMPVMLFLTAAGAGKVLRNVIIAVVVSEGSDLLAGG